MLFHKYSKSKTLTRALVVATGAVAVAMLAAGCTSTGSTPGTTTAAKNYKITFLPKNLGNNYFVASDSGGGKSAVESFKGTYAEVGPATASASGQVSYINTLTQQQVGAIVMSANDPKAMCSATKRAMAAGVKVITFDSDTNPGCRDLFVNSATSEGVAEAQADIIAKEINNTGQIAILSGPANATNQNTWNADMTKYMASKYPNIKIVTTVYGNDDAQLSFDGTAALVHKYPNLAGIVSPTTVGIVAAARWLSTSTYKGKIALTGLGTPNSMKAYVKDGTVKAFALWNPSNLGYLAAFAAKAEIDGTISGKKGQTFSAGKLGKFTVGPNKTVLLGKPTVFDASNIDQFNF